MLPIVGLEGKVVGEPEVRTTQAGKSVARFRMKCADRRKDEESGKWVDGDVLWVTVTAFGALGEHVMDSLVEGDQAIVLGRWSTAEWTDEQGNKRSAPRLVASAVGAGLQFAPRRHSEHTMAQHQRESVPAGAPPANDPWAF
jgi:single-strand DNA-binding protein